MLKAENNLGYKSEKFYDNIAEIIDSKIKNINRSKNIVIGFGITDKTIAALKKADGLVVGSQLCKTITNSLKKRLNTAKVLNKMVYKLKKKII